MINFLHWLQKKLKANHSGQKLLAEDRPKASFETYPNENDFDIWIGTRRAINGLPKIG